jgi:predicted dehydrogenase
MNYRAAVIGCGRIGSEFADDARIKGIYSHAGAYAACRRTELAAVCDIDPAKAAACGERWRVSAVYGDVPRLLAQTSPEIISVCTPDHTHAEILDAILNSATVRAVLVEKPLALDPESAAHLARLASERGILVAVNYSRRYSLGHARIRDMIAAGGIGRVQRVAGFYTKGVYHNGSHWFDLARMLVGEVERVHGFAVDEDVGRDPTLDAWLRFDSGASGFLQGCRADAFSVFEMDIVGTEGRVRFVDSGHRIEQFQVADSAYYSGYRELQKGKEQEGGLENTLVNAVEDLVQCLDHGGRPQCSAADGVAALAIAAAVVQSARVGSPVDVPAASA